jgi:DNA-directed RNA polymerase
VELQPSIEDQLKLERQMIDIGRQRYDQEIAKSTEQGRYADTMAARKLIENLMQPMVEELNSFMQSKGLRAANVRVLLERIDPYKAMFIAVKRTFNSFTKDERSSVITNLVLGIGKMIEDEVRFSRFRELHKNYYDEIIKDFKRKGTTDYRYMHRVMTHSANKHNDEWLEWTNIEKVQVGTKLLSIIMETADLCQKQTLKSGGKTYNLIVPTETAKQWIEKHDEIGRLMFPDKMPCIIPPDDWTALDQGGYFSPELRMATPAVQACSKYQKRILKKMSLEYVFEGLNILQSTQWAVNKQVLDVVMQVWNNSLQIGMPGKEKLVPTPSPLVDIPKDTWTAAQEKQFIDWKREASEVYTQEKERVAKSYQTMRIVRMANLYSRYEKFWYVWFADFRGRKYTATNGFSPQGPDLAKGLLRFANGKPIRDARGVYWFYAHGANKFGYDKASFAERVAWVEARTEEFIAAADDPLSHREVWAGADKPYQFLAWLFEFRSFCNSGRSMDFVSYLPLGQDGSCNGLQNYSAILRDEVGGRATNLVPSEKPSDIYAEVANVCYRKLIEKRGSITADTWLRFCELYGDGTVPRGMAKRPVMTLPYGATRNSCTKYIFQSLIETDKTLFESNWDASCWLSPILWESIGEVVVAAREAMDWLRKASNVCSRDDKPIIWTTADGFPAMQYSRKVDTHDVDTMLNGRIRIKVGTHNIHVDANKQRNGIAPNFIHSMDATHLRTTIRLAKRRGITDFACIHDDYGTHACDTDLLHKCIRDAFVYLYGQGDPLAAFKREQERDGIVLPELPKKGSLDLEAVKESLYFFG